MKSDNTVKRPEDWKTGDEPLTGAQNSYLQTLASEAHEEINTDLTKAEASEKIDELQHKTGRGAQEHEAAFEKKKAGKGSRAGKKR